MKSKIAGILILILLFFAVIPAESYCAEGEYSPESFKQIINSGKASVKSSGMNVFKTIDLSQASIKGGTQLVVSILTIPFIIAQGFVAFVSNGNPLNTVTVQSLVFNQNPLTDADYTATTINIYNNVVKKSVLSWFYGMRLLAIALSLAMLIYMGIRMAMSSVAQDKAKYKSMFIDWAFSFGFVFLMQYVIVLAMSISHLIVNLFANIEIVSFEQNLKTYNMFNYLLGNYNGLVFAALAFMYCIIIFYQIKFFLFYVRRLLAVGFLIIIAPLITITYSMDKAKDRKSQIFDTWMREFLGNMFIQPLHAGIYVVFIATANSIFTVAPILSIFLFLSLDRAEKIMKNIFGLKKMSSMRDLREMIKR